MIRRDLSMKGIALRNTSIDLINTDKGYVIKRQVEALKYIHMMNQRK